jgi:iron complex transport system ATP-binding protein
MTPDQNILQLNSLLVGYRNGKDYKALMPGISAGVRKGELVAVIGHNGIGKSTLLRVAAGLQSPIDGSVTLNGIALTGFTRYELAKSIGYVSTEQVKVNSMTVTDLVRLGRYPHTGWTGRFGADDHRHVEEAMQQAGIYRLSGRYINELSDGERQRAMVARVLAQDAEILIMDEPTAFLDVRSRYEMIHLLHDLSLNRGKTIIFSTHDMITAIGEADRVWLLFGDSFTDGAPEDLMLDGSFERLFTDSIVKFNSEDASFNFSRATHGTVHLKGSGSAMIWTGKALNRAGFGTSEQSSDITVSVQPGNDELTWHAEYKGNSAQFSRLYGLVNWLHQQNLDKTV